MVASEAPKHCRGSMSSFDIPGHAEVQADDCLSLWWAPLDISDSAMRRFAACLSPVERERADRLRAPLQRRRFVAARGWLRQLLGSQLHCAPRDIPIVKGEHGKPTVACSDLTFSASRTAGVALYATSRTMEVGVDIEAIRANVDIDGLAARFMSPAEQRALASLSARQRLEAFFQCWTRKEAYVKGIGTGLSFALQDVDVWRGVSQPATARGWTIHQVKAAPGFAAAVAGACLDDWVPQVPRRLNASSLNHSCRPSPAAQLTALVVSGR
jgi:4'-phosphopantetheinyl transferase